MKEFLEVMNKVHINLRTLKVRICKIIKCAMYNVLINSFNMIHQYYHNIYKK